MKKHILYYLLLLFSFSLTAGGFYAGLPVLSYLQTDRNCYVSGDPILLKAYHIILSDGSDEPEISLYVDLLSNDEEYVSGKVFRLKDGMASGYFMVPDSLKTGLYTLRVYTNYSQQFKGNEILYSKSLYVTNRFGKNGKQELDFQNRKDSLPFVLSDTIDVGSPLANLKLSNNTIGKRSKVDLQIKNLSSVPLNASLQVKPISDYEYFFDQENGNIMQSVHVRNSALSNKEIPIREHKGLVFTGKIKPKDIEESLGDKLVLLAFEDTLMQLKYSFTDSVGRFNFLVDEFYGDKMAYVSVYNYPSLINLDGVEVSLDPKFIQTESYPIIDNNSEYEVSRDSLNLQKSLVAKAYGISLIGEEQHLKQMPTFESEYLMSTVRQKIVMDDYVELDDFIEITKEILPFVKLKKSDDGLYFSILDGVNGVVRKNPMLFVDGVPLTDIDEILTWGTDRLRMVEVQVDTRYMGDVPFENGMVYIWTRAMDFWKSNEVKNTQTFTLEGFQTPVLFSFPDYSKNSNLNEPDFRQTLYWDPTVIIDAEDAMSIEFYTSDEKGVFEIILEGVSQRNEPFYIKKYLHVK